jgi:hypothetical protein
MRDMTEFSGGDCSHLRRHRRHKFWPVNREPLHKSPAIQQALQGAVKGHQKLSHFFIRLAKPRCVQW